jgi:hypothetical protein
VNCRSARRSERLSLIFDIRTQRLAGLFVQGKADFQGHLPIAYLSVLDPSAGLGHLKPSHVADRLFGARQCILYRLLKPVRRRTNYFDLFVNVIRHALIISRFAMEHNKKPGKERRSPLARP